MTSKKYYEEHKEQIREYNKKYNKEHSEERKIADKKYREENKDKIKEYNKMNASKSAVKHRLLRIKCLELIAEYHEVPIECSHCGERRQWLLTIAHINDDGNIDRELNGNIRNNILTNKRRIGDIQIECMNCNCCKSWYGKYPDDITNEEWDVIDTIHLYK